MALHNLAMIAFERGELEEGVRLAHEAASAAESVGFTWWRGVTLLSTAERLIAAGNLQAATPDYREGLRILADVPDLVNVPIALAAGAALAAGQGDAVGAGTLWGAVEAAGERDPRPTTSEALDEYAPYMAPVRGANFEQGRSRGRKLSLEAAVEHALAAIN
jgi:hypothetical protein